jgi:hypothetical protein
MSTSGLTDGETLLAEAAAKYFRDRYELNDVKQFEALDPALSWRPSLHFQRNNFVTIAAEVSEETPYPEILRRRRADIIAVHRPIAIYAVCPEEVCLSGDMQSEIKSLRAHGFGLLSVDTGGEVDIRFGCIPLMQHISEQEFRDEIRALPPKFRAALREAYDRYTNDAGSGLEAITQNVEALVKCAGKRTASKKWLDKKVLKQSVATLLDALYDVSQLHNARAAIGGVRGYMTEYRNVAHHAQTSRAKAHKKYQDCHNGFREGIRKIETFRTAFKHLKISLTL